MSDIQDHPEYRGLLAAVRTAPDDDLPRLVLADWLEEHDSPDWAEFIRAQCMLDRFPHAARIRADTYTDAEGVLPDWQQPLTAARRERELWPVVAAELFTGDLNEGQTAITTWDGRCLHVHSDRDQIPQFEARRGFVEEIECPIARWMGEGHHPPLGPLMVARQPVRQVVFTDRSWGDPDHCWFAIADDDRTDFSGGRVLPWCIACRLTGHTLTRRSADSEVEGWLWFYSSPEDAMAALSRAAIAWAEAEAGV